MYQYVDNSCADWDERAARGQVWIDPMSGEVCWPEVEPDGCTAGERLLGSLECFTDVLFGVGSRVPVGYARLIEYVMQLSADIGAESAREYACDVLSQLDEGSTGSGGCVLDEWGECLYMVRSARSFGLNGTALRPGRRRCKGGAGPGAMRR
jgi:hypothetical protein